MNRFYQRVMGLVRRRSVPHFSLHFRRAWTTWKRRPWRSFGRVTIVSLNPPVILAGAHPDILAKYLQPQLRGQNLTIFYRAGWSLEHPFTFRNRISAIKAAQRRFPLHKYIFAVNTTSERDLVRATGIRAEFLNENAFIDEFAF